MHYGLNHWGGLVRFLDDGRIEVDTNFVERSMRPQAPGTERWLSLSEQPSPLDAASRASCPVFRDDGGPPVAINWSPVNNV
jgi:transposase